MKLSELKIEFPELHFQEDVELSLSQLKRDNHSFQKGDLFVAIPGNSWDGHSFLEEAAKLASLVVYQKQKGKAEYGCPSLAVESPRATYERLAYLLSQSPTKDLFCVGVTGTNGKTSTTCYLEQLLNSDQHLTGVIGTIDHHVGSKVWPSELTSPGPKEFYSRILEMKSEGADSLCVELSSHALDQDRMSSMDLDIGIFTNLTQDHLDYHKTMESYFLAKEKIASLVLKRSSKKKKYMILNADSEWSKSFPKVFGVIFLRVGKSEFADIQIRNIQLSVSGSRFDLNLQGRAYSIQTPLLGEHNIYNLSFAIVAANLRGISMEKLQEQAQKIREPKGRMQSLENTGEIHVFVDFAHSPDGLESIGKFLKQIQAQQKFRVICVFGAGGDRDKGKRPKMAQAVQGFSDYSIVTSDNPRSEDPQQIVDEVARGFTDSTHPIEKILDRSQAIERAIRVAEKGDLVLIAGKGHEEYQEIQGKKHAFSDALEVKKIIEKIAKEKK